MYEVIPLFLKAKLLKKANFQNSVIALLKNGKPLHLQFCKPFFVFFKVVHYFLTFCLYNSIFRILDIDKLTLFYRYD